MIDGWLDQLLPSTSASGVRLLLFVGILLLFSLFFFVLVFKAAIICSDQFVFRPLP